MVCHCSLDSLSDDVVSAETVNTFKNWLDRFWSNQDVLYDYRADLHGIRNRTIVMQLQYCYALYTSSFIIIII